MKVLVVGGGSGGHVTPVVAVINEIKQLRPRVQVRFLTDRKFYKTAGKLLRSEGLDIKLYKVSAGKFRRYTHFGVLDYLKHPSILLANLFDLVKVAIGIIQSQLIIIRYRPDVIFVKGGFVGLPAGLAAGLLWPRVPIVIHDSDVVPGLTNRILSRFATKIATGMPLENYDYAPERSAYVGIPIDVATQPPSDSHQAALKAKFGFDSDRPLTVVTGGGLGSKRINTAVIDQLGTLLKHTSVALIAGKDQYSELAEIKQPEGFKLYEFITDGVDDMFGAADVVVSRAGATTIAELAALARPTILVPNAMLPSSHQVKNAEVLAAADAVEIVNDDELEDHPQVLAKAITSLVGDGNRRVALSKNLYKFAKPNAAQDLAEIIVKAAK